MGEIPIRPTTLKDYCELTETQLYKEEAAFLLNLSKHYCREINKYSDDKNRQIGAPYGFVEIQGHIDKHNKAVEAKRKKLEEAEAKTKEPEKAESKDKV